MTPDEFKKKHLATRIAKIDKELSEGCSISLCEQVLLRDVINHYQAIGWVVRIGKTAGASVLIHLLDPSGPAVAEMAETPLVSFFNPLLKGGQ